MPVEYKVPGVYIEEPPSGSRPIAGVTTAMPVFIGFTRTRPEGNTGQPVFIAGWNQYVEQFCSWQEPRKRDDGQIVLDETGKIVFETKSDPFVPGFYLSHAVYGYFMNGGQSCYIQSLKTLDDTNSLYSSASGTLMIPAMNGRPALELETKGSNGEKRDVRQLQIVVDTAKEVAEAKAKAEDAAKKAEDAAKKAETAEQKANAALKSKATTVQQEADTTKTKADATQQEPNAAQRALETAQQAFETAKKESETAQRAFETAQQEADAKSAAMSDWFDLTIKWGDKEEKHSNLTRGPAAAGARNVREALKQSQYVELKETQYAEGVAPLVQRPTNATHDKLSYAFTERLANEQTFKGDVMERTGLGALEEVADITMVVCPDLMSAYMRTNKTEDDQLLLAGVQKELLAHCFKMKDRFAILDAPPAMKVEEVRKYRETTANFGPDTGKYGAFYYPWIQIANPKLNNGQDRIITIPPSGHIAGIYARVDADRGVHKAPANEEVIGALKLERRVIDPEQAILNPRGINCIREFPGRGIRVWGARTLAEEASEWRYINVRRLFNFVEESIYEGTQWVVFEPNDMDLWERVKRTITAFLTRVWQSGALLGATPEEAFYVKCDAELNPRAVRDAGQLIVEVGIAPVKPAEFVVFRFKQMSGGGSIAE